MSDAPSKKATKKATTSKKAAAASGQAPEAASVQKRAKSAAAPKSSPEGASKAPKQKTQRSEVASIGEAASAAEGQAAKKAGRPAKRGLPSAEPPAAADRAEGTKKKPRKETGTALAAAADRAEGAKKKPRKEKGAAPAVDDEATRARKELQRARQREAIAARAGGQAFAPTKRVKKRLPKERREFEKREASKLKDKRELGKKLRKEKKAAPDVVVVPIFWKGQQGQRGAVIASCVDIVAALVSSGLKAEMDAGTKYTPGQKFAHWEHRGVTLRVEVGPREAERGCCTLARTFTPGEPAYRCEGVKTDAETLAAGLKSLAALKEEEVEKAAAAAAAVKGQTHNGQLWNRPARAVAEAPAVAAEGGSDAVDAPEGPKRALKAKVVKF